MFGFLAEGWPFRNPNLTQQQLLGQAPQQKGPFGASAKLFPDEIGIQVDELYGRQMYTVYYTVFKKARVSSDVYSIDIWPMVLLYPTYRLWNLFYQWYLIWYNMILTLNII